MSVKSVIVDVCQRLDARAFVANHDGNVSVRLSEDRFLATPTSFAKRDIKENDLLLVDFAGKVLEGPHRVFSEWVWHQAIYGARPDAQAVVHAHPPVASGFGLARRELGTPCLPEAIVSLGRHISNIDFYSPLDPALAQSGSRFENDIAAALADSDAFIAPGNGVWAVGRGADAVLQAYLRLELVEQVARQHEAALSLGGPKPLDADLVEALLKKRPRVQSGAQAPSPAAPLDLEALKDIVRQELDALA